MKDIEDSPQMQEDASSSSSSSATNGNSDSTTIYFKQLAIIMVGLICMGAALGFERSLLVSRSKVLLVVFVRSPSISRKENNSTLTRNVCLLVYFLLASNGCGSV